LTAGKTFLLAIGTVAFAILGVIFGLFVLIGVSLDGHMGIPLPVSCVVLGAAAGAFTAVPLARWFRSKRALAIGAGIGATLGIAAMPFI
jgi:hypothetical protein